MEPTTFAFICGLAAGAGIVALACAAWLFHIFIEGDQ